MRMTIGQKATRVLQFLLGLRFRSIAAALAVHGFDDAELARGWELLRSLSYGRLSTLGAEARDTQIVTSLDAWENKWYPIASASVAARFPAVHEALFVNLAQTSGPEVIVTVGMLVDRIERLPRPRDEGGLGAEGEAARELLTRRGLTAEVIAEARALLERATELEEADEEIVEPTSPSDEESEEAMWRWYLEWSEIARTVITDRRRLRALGFLRRNESGEDEPEVEIAAPESGAPTEPA